MTVWAGFGYEGVAHMSVGCRLATEMWRTPPMAKDPAPLWAGSTRKPAPAIVHVIQIIRADSFFRFGVGITTK